MRLLSALLVFGLLQTASAQAPERVESLRLLGIYDAETGQWIDQAIVRDTLGVETKTTKAGIAALNVLTPIAGFYLLEIRKVGYAPRHLRLRAESTIELMIALEPAPLADATRLPTTVITERQRLVEDAGLRSGFFARCQANGVACIGRKDIEGHPTAMFDELVGRANGIRRECTAGNRPVTAMVAPSKSPDPRAGLMGCLLQMRPAADAQYCTPSYVVDGFEWHPFRGERVQAEVEKHLTPDRIEGIEVYLANTPRPGRFNVPATGCGVIVIWTRRAP
jgi:hypothetical protein